MRKLAWTGLLFALACGEEGARRLRPTAVSPTQGPNDVAVELLVHAESFEAQVHTDFGRRERSAHNERFEVQLLPVDQGLSPIELLEVRRVDEKTLAATIPPGAARGFYGLWVKDPFGREGLLPEVYRVVASPSTLSAFRIDTLGPQRPGVPFGVTVTAVDAALGTVDGFVGSVSLADRTGTLSPSSLGPFNLGRARGTFTVTSFAATNRLRVEGAGKLGESNEFPVRPGLAVQLAFVSAPTTLAVGRCSDRVELEARDSFGFPSAAEAPIEVQLHASPPDGFSFYADSACQTSVAGRTLPEKTSRLSFYVRGETAGTVSLRAVPELFPTSSHALFLEALVPQKLGFATPERTVIAGQCSSPLTVRPLDAFGNPSALDMAVGSSVSVRPSGVATLFSDSACTTPLSAPTLPPGLSGLTFYARGGLAGQGVVEATTAGGALLSASQGLTVLP